MLSHPLAKLLGDRFNNPESSDVQVHLNDNQVLHCHRFVLGMWSDVWAAALQDMKESSLDLTGHDASIVELCLHYCYCAPIELNDNNLTKVHLFAQQYDLKALQASCKKEFIHSLSITNCMERYRYLFEHEFPNLESSELLIKEFVFDEFVAVSKTEGFLNMPLQIVCDLLHADGINAAEDEVLAACCRWLGDSPDPQEREQVLKYVRFPLLSAKTLVGFRTHVLFQPDLAQRYTFAMEWMVVKQIANVEDRTPLTMRLNRECPKHLVPRAEHRNVKPEDQNRCE